MDLNLIFASVAVVVASCFLSIPAQGQGSLSLGTITVSQLAWQCDPTGGWYYYQNGNNDTYMNCQNAVINCPNTQNISLAFGEINPANVGLVSKALGTIVIFGGDGGTSPGNFGFADRFFKAGYEIVEIAWAGDWEPTYSPFSQGQTASIQNAACRPATFLNFVYTTFFANTKNANSLAAYCAHGASAGSAEIAYSLAFYGAGNWLDYTQLLAGPVFSDIKQGCQVPAPSNVNICTPTDYNCQLGNSPPPFWQMSPS